MRLSQIAYVDYVGKNVTQDGVEEVLPFDSEFLNDISTDHMSSDKTPSMRSMKSSDVSSQSSNLSVMYDNNKSILRSAGANDSILLNQDVEESIRLNETQLQ